MSDPAEDPRAFLEAQGWRVKRQGQQLVTACPFCGKADKFYMHQTTGLWQCWVCGEKGNLRGLNERLGLLQPHRRGPGIEGLGPALGAQKRRIPFEQVERMHAALLGDAEAMQYATKTRAWSADAIKQMKIGLRVDGRGKWLAFPWLRKGQCIGVKYRILPAFEKNYPERFDREAGCESTLWNRDALDRGDEVILASGESDGMALMTLGFRDVVASTTGELSLPVTDVDALAKKAKVLVPYDNDSAGQKGVREVAKRLGFERTWLVSLPAGVKDVNEFLVHGGTREQFATLLAAATQFDVPSVLTLPQALDALEEEQVIGTWDTVESITPWPVLNRRLGRWRGGNLVVVSGPPGTGKTTFALNVAAWWAAYGSPALFYCLEMSVVELVQLVLCAHYQIEEEQITGEVIAKARLELAEWPLYLGSDPRLTGQKDVMSLLDQAVRRYGLKLLFFDNLHILARSIQHRSEEVGVLTKGFKLFAMQHEIPVGLIAQPRKLEPGKVMTPWDLKESVDIFADADQVVLLHREMQAATKEREAVTAADEARDDKTSNNLSPLTLVRLAKARHRASRDCTLYFEGAQHRFRALTPDEFKQGTVP